MEPKKGDDSTAPKKTRISVLGCRMRRSSMPEHRCSTVYFSFSLEIWLVSRMSHPRNSCQSRTLPLFICRLNMQSPS